MGFLHGKRALITGVLNHRSIAWGIANAMHREGAELAFTYVNDKLKDRVDEAANAFGSNIVLPCDVTSDAQIDALFAELGKHWDGVDIVVHSIGFAPREALTGEFLDGLTRESLRDRARHLELQLRRAGQGRAADDEGSCRRAADADLSRLPTARFRTTT